MGLLAGDDFDNLFRTFERTAFHLELQDSYHVPEESGPLTLFLEGKPDDFAWHQQWLRLVREVRQAGKRMTRARVVTVPHSDYARWGMMVAPLNIEAGEDIRWLPRHLAGGIDFPADDYWLFDDRRLVFTVFHDDGRFLGGTETTDAGVIEQCRRVHDQVWPLAIPHAEYITSQYASR
jgi:hypothetical protein